MMNVLNKNLEALQPSEVSSMKDATRDHKIFSPWFHCGFISWEEEWWESRRLGLLGTLRIMVSAHGNSLPHVSLPPITSVCVVLIRRYMKSWNLFIVYWPFNAFSALLKRILESSLCWQFLKAVRMKRKKIFLTSNMSLHSHGQRVPSDHSLLLPFYTQSKANLKKVIKWLLVQVIESFDYCLKYFKVYRLIKISDIISLRAFSSKLHIILEIFNEILKISCNYVSKNLSEGSTWLSF